jgi:hypothetical protein
MEAKNMIEITGTEKQVAWATSIRETFTASAAKEAAYWEDEIAGCIEDDDAEGAEWAKEKLEKHTRLTAEILDEVSSAAWWIEYGRADVLFVIRTFENVKRGIALGGEKKIK